MDFHSNDAGNINSTSDMWQWQQEEEYCLSTNSQFGLPLWEDNGEKGESLPYTMANQTPLRSFGDFDLDVLDIGDEVEKGVEEAKEASRVKRRRVLYFFPDDDGATAVNEHLSSEIVQEDSTSANICTQNLQSNLTCSDDRFLFSNEVLDPSSDEWMDNYFNDSEMSSSMNDQVKLNSQIDVSDFLTGEPDTKTKVLPNPSKSSTLRIFKGRKHISSLTKLTTSVAYPFTLIKPSEIQGHMTLKEINQRIHSPPSSRPRNETVDDPSVSYPTSAFSGKPVIVKTKILTEGGKGSITILRTKG